MLLLSVLAVALFGVAYRRMVPVTESEAISVTPSGSVSEASAGQLMNALFPIAARFSERVMLVRAVQLIKALLPRRVTLSAISTLCSAAQSKKPSYLISVTPSGITAAVISLL